MLLMELLANWLIHNTFKGVIIKNIGILPLKYFQFNYQAFTDRDVWVDNNMRRLQMWTLLSM